MNTFEKTASPSRWFPDAAVRRPNLRPADPRRPRSSGPTSCSFMAGTSNETCSPAIAVCSMPPIGDTPGARWTIVAGCLNGFAIPPRLPADERAGHYPAARIGPQRRRHGPLGSLPAPTAMKTIFNVTYPTTRGSIDEHAEQLARVIQNLDGIGQLSLSRP